MDFCLTSSSHKPPGSIFRVRKLFVLSNLNVPCSNLRLLLLPYPQRTWRTVYHPHFFAFIFLNNYVSPRSSFSKLKKPSSFISIYSSCFLDQRWFLLISSGFSSVGQHFSWSVLPKLRHSIQLRHYHCRVQWKDNFTFHTHDSRVFISQEIKIQHYNSSINFILQKCHQ